MYISIAKRIEIFNFNKTFAFPGRGGGRSKLPTPKTTTLNRTVIFHLAALATWAQRALALWPHQLIYLSREDRRTILFYSAVKIIYTCGARTTYFRR